MSRHHQCCALSGGRIPAHPHRPHCHCSWMSRHHPHPSSCQLGPPSVPSLLLAHCLEEGIRLVFVLLIITALRCLVIILSHHLVSLVLQACHLCCLRIVIINVAPCLEEGFLLIFTVLTVTALRCLVIILSHHLVSLVL